MNKVNKDQVSLAIVASKVLEKQAAPLLKRIGAVSVIETSKDYDSVASDMKKVKALLKEAGKQKESLKQSLKAIEAHFKPFEAAVKIMEQHAKDLMLAYRKTNQDKIELLNSKMEGGKLSIEQWSSKVADLSVSSSVAKTRNLQKLKITDAAKIPKKFLVPDEAAITTALKNGEKVPGCELILVESISI